MKKWKSICSGIFCTILLAGCAPKQETVSADPDLTCKNLIVNAFNMTQEEFFEAYQIDQEKLEIKESSSAIAVYLSETAPLAGYEVPLQLWFYETDDGYRLQGVRYSLYLTKPEYLEEVQQKLDERHEDERMFYPVPGLFETEGDLMETGYQTIGTAYDELREMFGEPNSGFVGQTPLETLEDYDAFLERYAPGIFGDGYSGGWNWDLTEEYGQDFCEHGDSFIPYLSVTASDGEYPCVAINLEAMRTVHRPLMQTK